MVGTLSLFRRASQHHLLRPRTALPKPKTTRAPSVFSPSFQRADIASLQDVHGIASSGKTLCSEGSYFALRPTSHSCCTDACTLRDLLLEASASIASCPRPMSKGIGYSWTARHAFVGSMSLRIFAQLPDTDVAGDGATSLGRNPTWKFSRPTSE
jgi:hypothetical protein